MRAEFSCGDPQAESLGSVCHSCLRDRSPDASAACAHCGSKAIVVACEGCGASAIGVSIPLERISLRDPTGSWIWPGTKSDADIASMNDAVHPEDAAFLCARCSHLRMAHATRLRLVDALIGSLGGAALVLTMNPSIAITGVLAATVCWWLYYRASTLAKRPSRHVDDSISVLAKEMRRERLKRGIHPVNRTT